MRHDFPNPHIQISFKYSLVKGPLIMLVEGTHALYGVIIIVLTIVFIGLPIFSVCVGLPENKEPTQERWYCPGCDAS